MNVNENTLARLSRFRTIALIIGLVGVVALVAGFLLGSSEQFFRSYLVAYLFWLGLTLGPLGLAMVHYLTGGDWGFLIRQALEAAYKNSWLMAILFVPLAFGLPVLYLWAQPEVVAANPLLEHKAPYLNVPFFLIRTVLYFVIWIGFAIWLSRWSRIPEYNTNPERRRIFQRLAAIGVIVYSLTMTFASFDWMMSIEAEWFSSIYGMLIITGQAVSAFAFGILLLPLLLQQPTLNDWSSPRRFRDLGAFLLAAVTFWAYISYSQLVIIWSGNMPIETTWYLTRSGGGWLWIGIAVFLIQFLLPFSLLITLWAKRNLRVLVTLSSIILLMRYLDNYWMVMPAYFPEGVTFHWLDLAALLGIGGIWVALFLHNLTRTPLFIPPARRVQEHSHEPVTHSTASLEETSRTSKGGQSAA